MIRCDPYLLPWCRRRSPFLSTTFCATAIPFFDCCVMCSLVATGQRSGSNHSHISRFVWLLSCLFYFFFRGGGDSVICICCIRCIAWLWKIKLIILFMCPSLVAIVNGSMSLERLLIRYEFENRQARHWNAGNFTCSLILKLVNDEEFLWSLWPESSRTI